MTFVSFKTGTQSGAGHLEIKLSDGSLLHIKGSYLNEHPKKPAEAVNPLLCQEALASWQPGRAVSPDEEEALRFADACFRAEQMGMRLIARAEQTEAGLSRKLEIRGHASSCVSAVMARFIENNLVNDERYAERWLRSRLARKSGKTGGPRRLSAALGSRGIGREALKGAFDKALDEEAEFALLQRFLSKERRGTMSGAYSLKGLLRYEGFSSPVINRYFDETS